MAILHKKEEKIQAVLGRLPKKYTDDEFLAMFIKLYSKDWGKIKSAYIKQSQDKEPGTIINMPKPDLYLKQLLEIYLRQHTPPVEEAKAEEIKIAKPIPAAPKKPIAEEKPAAKAAVKKPAVKKKETATEKPAEVVKKVKTIAKKASDGPKAPTKTVKPKVSKK